MPQQRPKKQEDVDGRILIARNVHWTLPLHLRHAIESPIAAQRLSAVDGLGHLHRMGNDIVRSAVAEQVAALAADDSRSVSSAATALQERLTAAATAVPGPRAAVETQEQRPRPAAEEQERARADAEQRERVAAAERERVAAGERERARALALAEQRAELDRVMAELRAPRLTVQADRSRTEGVPRTATDGEAEVAGFAVPMVLALVLVGGVLQLLSRFLVFESTYTAAAADAGLATPPWLLAVGVPLAAASLLLIARSGEPWALALSGGLIGGAALSQLDQSLATLAYWATPDSYETAGPGWWLAVVGAVALLAGLAIVLRGPGFRDRPVLRRDWRIATAGLVLGALALKLEAFAEAWPWLSQNEPAILLALACLPPTLLVLNRAQRLLCLVAVTVFGLWVCAAHVYALAYQSFPVDERAAVLAIVAALVSVLACYLAQVGGRTALRASEAEGADRR
jgi:hypothetical protein